MGGSAAGTAGGLVDVAGLAAAPFTGGASLLPAALTAGAIGAGASLVGGGGSTPAGSGGSGFPQNTPGGAYAYTPQFQPQQDWMLNQLLSGQGGSVLGQAFTDQQPASQQYWNQALPQSLAGFNLVNGPQSFAGQLPGNVLNNPYYQQAQTGADTAAYNTLQAAYGGYGTGQSTILGNLNQALGQSQPGVLQAIQNVLQGGQTLGGYAGNVAGMAPGLPGLGQQTAGLTTALADPLQGLGQQAAGITSGGIPATTALAGSAEGFAPTIVGTSNLAAGLPGLGQQAAGITSGGIAPSQQLAGQAAGIAPLLQQIAGISGQLPGFGQQAAGVSQAGIPASQGLAGQGAAMAPQFAQQLQQAYQPLGQAAGQILQTGFDPQSALYNRTAQQVLDQQRAVNAMSGVGTSPYGAGVTGQTMSNFNIDWQNQQLQRQAQAAQSAGALTGMLPGFQSQALAGLANAQGMQAAPGALAGQGLQQQISAAQAAGGLQNQALSSLAAAQGAQAAPGALAGQALQQQISPIQAAGGVTQQGIANLQGAQAAAAAPGALAGQAAQQQIGANQAAAGLYNQALQQQISPIQAAGGLYNQAGGLTGQQINAAQMAGGLYSGLPGLNQAYTGAYGGLGQQIAQSAAQPGQTYLAQQQATQNALNTYLSQLGQSQGLTTGAVNIGQSQYNEPNQLLTAMQNYLSGGRSAAQLAGNLGQIGSQQSTQGLAGLAGLGATGSNLLFGQNSPFAANSAFNQGGGLLGAASPLLGSTTNFGNYAGTGLSASDVASLSADPAQSLAAFNAANAGGSGLLGWFSNLFSSGG